MSPGLAIAYFRDWAVDITLLMPKILLMDSGIILMVCAHYFFRWDSY